VLIKPILRYDVVAHARDRERFTHQLRVPTKTLEMERRILVLLRDAGCNAVPLTQDELQPVVQEAIARWAAAGIDPGHLSALSQVRVGIAEFPSP
jgi:hypothetical protein